MNETAASFNQCSIFEHKNNQMNLLDFLLLEKTIMEDYDGGEVQLEFEEYGKEGDPRPVSHTINIKSEIFDQILEK